MAVNPPDVVHLTVMASQVAVAESQVWKALRALGVDPEHYRLETTCTARVVTTSGDVHSWDFDVTAYLRWEVRAK